MTSPETTAAAITEITDCVQAEAAGRVLGTDGDTVRIKFNTVEHAVTWVSNYATIKAATFETPPATMSQRVIVRLSIAAYARAAGL